MNSGILITYSWGDYEPLIPCKKEDAMEKIISTASAEARETIISMDSSCRVDFCPDSLQAKLYYDYDGTYCVYEFVEDYKEEANDR